jgi:hypothetical protein
MGGPLTASAWPSRSKSPAATLTPPAKPSNARKLSRVAPVAKSNALTWDRCPERGAAARPPWPGQVPPRLPAGTKQDCRAQARIGVVAWLHRCTAMQTMQCNAAWPGGVQGCNQATQSTGPSPLHPFLVAISAAVALGGLVCWAGRAADCCWSPSCPSCPSSSARCAGGAARGTAPMLGKAGPTLRSPIARDSGGGVFFVQGDSSRSAVTVGRISRLRVLSRNA